MLEVRELISDAGEMPVALGNLRPSCDCDGLRDGLRALDGLRARAFCQRLPLVSDGAEDDDDLSLCSLMPENRWDPRHHVP